MPLPAKAEDSSFAHSMKSYDARGDDFPGGLDICSDADNDKVMVGFSAYHHAGENNSSLDNFCDGVVVDPFDVGYDGGQSGDPYDGYDGDDWWDPYDGYDDGDSGDQYDGYDNGDDLWDPYDSYDHGDDGDSYDGYDDGDGGDPYDGYDGDDWWDPYDGHDEEGGDQYGGYDGDGEDPYDGYDEEDWWDPFDGYDNGDDLDRYIYEALYMKVWTKLWR